MEDNKDYILIRAIAFNYFVDEKSINHSLPRLKRGIHECILFAKGKYSSKLNKI